VLRPPPPTTRAPLRPEIEGPVPSQGPDEHPPNAIPINASPARLPPVYACRAFLWGSKYVSRFFRCYPRTQIIYFRVGSSTSIPQRCAISPRQTHPKPPPQTACPRVDCACTTRRASRVFVRVRISFFSSFFSPNVVCFTPAPDNPRASLHPLTPRSRSIRAVARYRRKPSRCHRPECLPRAPPCASPPKPRTHDTHEACGARCFCGGLNR